MMKDADAFRLSSFSFGFFLQNKRFCVPPWMKDADASRSSSLGFALPLNERYSPSFQIDITELYAFANVNT